MTAIGGIIDPDKKARQTFLSAVGAHFASNPLEVSDRRTVGELECVWQTTRTAPISTAQSNETTVYVLGHLDGTETDKQSHAERIADHLAQKGLDGVACYSGFFLAIIARANDTYIFCDQLGLFPCYYATAGRALVIGTSSYIPGLHPSIPRRLNKKALVSHLLCMHELLGESLWEGVRHLDPGEILHFADGALYRIAQQPVPISDDGFGLSAARQLEQAHEAMLDAFREYRGQSVSLLCSGGLDSRLAAAYAVETQANTKMVYTLGDPRDNDYRCARRAIGELGLAHQRVPVDVTKYPQFLEHQIVGEQLANGVNDLGWWSLLNGAAGADAPFVTGFVGDAVLGGSHIAWGYDPEAQAFSFECLYPKINTWGLPEQTVCELLPNDPVAQWIAEIRDGLRALYDALPGCPFQKVWQFDLRHRQRFHVAGPMIRLSRVVWPTAPLAAGALLKVSGSMPACALMDRQLQKNLLITRFPNLARIPIDITQTYPRQLIPSITYRVTSKIANVIGRRWRRLWDRDNRYYYRIYNLNGAGWRRLRTQCHHSCDRLADVLDVERLRTVVPAPGIRVQNIGAQAQSGTKSLLGFVLWYNRYADGLT